ncbi:unnamed protein product, partial [Symbiodinium necroappetens]
LWRRRKEEFVSAIACRCTVSPEDLRQHSVDRLKELWAVLKPRKNSSILPTGWKKFELPDLRALYVNKVLEDLSLNCDHDGHWMRWKKTTQFIMELEMWETDMKEATKHEVDVLSEHPFCRACQIPMVVRTNRLTREEFYGCRRYPVCRVQGEFENPLKKKPVNSGYIKKDMDEIMEKKGKGKETRDCKRGGMPPQATPGASSDGSWIAAGAQPLPESSDEEDKRIFNANLTAEEIAAVQLLREQKNSPDNKK